MVSIFLFFSKVKTNLIAKFSAILSGISGSRKGHKDHGLFYQLFQSLFVQSKENFAFQLHVTETLKRISLKILKFYCTFHTFLT